MTDKKYANREEVKTICDDYKLILDTESHHDHKIIMDGQTPRWEKSPIVSELVCKMGINDFVFTLSLLGYGKNSEVYRKLYRDLGYSLSGYWEVFYWDLNNEDAGDYRPQGEDA